ncbi:MAG: hypothetical protein AAF216_08225 [Pseudomonadota bacterium]
MKEEEVKTREMPNSLIAALATIKTESATQISASYPPERFWASYNHNEMENQSVVDEIQFRMKKN